MEWKAAKRGGFEAADLTRLLGLVVEQERAVSDGLPPLWRVKVFGATLARKFDTVDDAKAAAIRVAKSHLLEALAAMR